MRSLYIAFFAALSLAACSDSGTKIPLANEQDFQVRLGESQEEDRAQLEKMRQEIVDLIGEARCADEKDCRYIAFGAKPCGGPWTYMVYSAGQTDPDELAAKVEKYNKVEAAMNEKYGAVSDCSLPGEPQVGCVEGRCVDLHRQGSVDGGPAPGGDPSDPVHHEPHPVDPGTGSELRSLTLSEDLEGQSDPFLLHQAHIRGDVLMLEITYSGGCAEHEFELLARRGYEKSLPPRHQLRLVHHGHGDACEAAISQVLYFDLTPLRKIHEGQEKVLLYLADADPDSPSGRDNPLAYELGTCRSGEHATEPGMGVLALHVDRGPVSPVVGADGEGPSSAPVEGAVLAVWSASGEKAARLKTDGKGQARVELPAGEYRVAVEQCPGAMHLPDEQKVEIGEGLFTALHFGCDTGIR